MQSENPETFNSNQSLHNWDINDVSISCPGFFLSNYPPNARGTKFLEEKEVIIGIIALYSLPCHPLPEGQESSILSAALLTEVEDTRPDGESPASRQCIEAITVVWLLSRAEIKSTIFYSQSLYSSWFQKFHINNKRFFFRKELSFELSWLRNCSQYFR